MGWTRVQKNNAEANATSVGVPFVTANLTPGNTIIAIAMVSGNAVVPTLSISDNAVGGSNVYTSLINRHRTS